MVIRIITRLDLVVVKINNQANMKWLQFIKVNKKIGIDLGSSQTRVWVEGMGVVFTAPSCVAVEGSKVVTIGEEAREMSGRVSSDIRVVYPVQEGVVYDDKLLKSFLQMVISQALKKVWLLNPIIMVTVPASSTQADREIVTKVMYQLGASSVYTIAQPLSASIGSGVSIADASGSFILHLGSGVAEGVVISLGSIIALSSSNFAGDRLTQKIILFLKKQFLIQISSEVAEKILHQCVSINPKLVKEMMVSGFDIESESPKEIKLLSTDLAIVIQEFLDSLENLLQSLLSKMPPELTVDVIDKGLLVSGGLANLVGLDDYFISKLGISVSTVDEPDTVAILGVGLALEHLSLFEKSLGSNG